MFNMVWIIIFYVLCGMLAARTCKDFDRPVWVQYSALLAGPISCIVIFVYLLLYVIMCSYDDNIFKD